MHNASPEMALQAWLVTDTSQSFSYGDFLFLSSTHSHSTCLYQDTTALYENRPPPRFHLSLPFTLCLLKSENRFLHISSQAPVPNPHDKAHHPLHSLLKCVMPGLIKIPFPHLCAKNINAGRPASLSS